jgi:hypothetical protein
MPQHQPETPLVAVQQRVERPIHQAGEPFLAVHDAQEPAAQHRRERDRHDAGDENRRGDRDRELAEQPAEDAAHEQDRNEDGRERRGHRQDREADFSSR